MGKMQNFFIFCACASLIFSAFSCATTKKNTPDWVGENWRSIFPDSKYLAEKASAENSNLAKTESLASLSRYISTSVNANLNTQIHSIDKDGIVDETISIQNDVSVRSEVNLFGVEFTEPFFVKSEKKYYCIAYIDREKAWNQYVPQIEIAKKTFDGFFENAQTEAEPLFVCAFYKNAWEKGKDFLTKLEYGRLINPSREASYKADRNRLALIPSKIEAEIKNIAIKIEIEGDYAKIIETATENAFKKAGYTISKNGNYTAQIFIEANEFGSDPIAIFPSIDLKLVGKQGRTVYSYKERIDERSTGFSIETAKKRAFPKLAQKIEAEIPTQLLEITKAN